MTVAARICGGGAMPDIDLPTASLAGLAFEMKLIADQQAFGAAALEVQVARDPSPVFATGLIEARRGAERAGDVYRLLRALAPHEAAVRAIIAGEERE